MTHAGKKQSFLRRLGNNRLTGTEKVILGAVIVGLIILCILIARSQ